MTVTPKMHFLEVHMVPWLERWGVGLGMMGEQGSESIHARFNSIRGSYRSVPNPVERLRLILSEHYLQINPSNICMQPVYKKRKVEEKLYSSKRTYLDKTTRYNQPTNAYHVLEKNCSASVAAAAEISLFWLPIEW